MDTGPFDPLPHILFIDFDGVLHDVDDGDLALENGEMLIVGEMLFQWAPILSSLLDGRDDVAVAVHSSWRRFHSDDELRALLPGSLGRLFRGSTDTGLSRSESIEAFAQDHQARSILILDDRPQDFPEGQASLHVCDPHAGVSSAATQAAIASWLASLPAPSRKASPA